MHESRQQVKSYLTRQAAQLDLAGNHQDENEDDPSSLESPSASIAQNQLQHIPQRLENSWRDEKAGGESVNDEE